MRNFACLALGSLALGGIFVGNASAQVVFSDNFENEPVSAPDGLNVIGAPDVGQSWTEGNATVSGAHGVDIVDSPALGTRALRITREGAPPVGPSNGNIDGISLPNTILDGNIVEVKWSNALFGGAGHRFNGPIQMSIGHAGSDYDNDMAFISVNDPDNGAYHYTNSIAQYGGNTSSGVQPTLGGLFDTVRAVLTFAQVDATTMGGTYDLFVTLNGGVEQQLANDALLGHTSLAVADPTSMQLRIGTGPFTSYSHYDDISITVVPEPSTMAIGGLVAGLLSLRRRMA